jgi:hypothetical protein
MQPATWTPVEVERSTGYDPSHRGSEDSLDRRNFNEHQITRDNRVEKKTGHERCLGVTQNLLEVS